MPFRAHARSLCLSAVLVAAWACSHSDSFQDPDETSHGPFSPAVPIQLTYNPGPDITPAFLPGDTLVLFSFRRQDEAGENLCVGALPVAGGTTISESCPRSAAALDSTERYENPVPLDDSTIVLVQALQRRGGGVDDAVNLGTAPWRRADQFTSRLTFPVPTGGGVLETSASYLSLLGGSDLAFLAMVDVSACPGIEGFCDRPTVQRIGREVARLDLAATGDPSVIPGTDYATSVAAGRTPGSILFTLPFDSRVYEWAPNGSVDTLIDFGEIVRDPMLVGNQLIAIVGGDAQRWTTGEGVPVQVDGGGPIVLVDLGTGQQQLVSGDFYTRPQLSADLRVVIAVGRDDLYRLDRP